MRWSQINPLTPGGWRLFVMFICAGGFGAAPFGIVSALIVASLSGAAFMYVAWSRL